VRTWRPLDAKTSAGRDMDSNCHATFASTVLPASVCAELNWVPACRQTPHRATLCRRHASDERAKPVASVGTVSLYRSCSVRVRRRTRRDPPGFVPGSRPNHAP